MMHVVVVAPSQLFVCSAYIVFVATNVSAVAGIGGSDGSDGSEAPYPEPYPRWVVLALLPPFLVLVCLRDMSALSGVSALGNLFVVASLATILVVAAPHMSAAAWRAPVVFDAGGMAKFFGIAVRRTMRRKALLPHTRDARHSPEPIIGQSVQL